MRDHYYYKSLLSTVLVLLVFFSLISAFIYITGIAGVFIIVVLIVTLLGYFYSGIGVP